MGDHKRRGFEWWGKCLILCLFVPLFSVWLWNYSAELTRRRDTAQRTATYAATSQQYIAQTCPRRATPALIAACTEEALETARERQRREAEARAQEETATWTRIAVFIGIVGLFVSAGGILVLLRTIRQGQEELAHSRETAEAELRPWLEVRAEPSFLMIDEKGVNFSFTANVENLGRSPAQNVRIGYRLLPIGRDALRRCRSLFLMPEDSFLGKEEPRALLPQGKSEFIRQARMSREEADGLADPERENRLPNFVLLVIAYYNRPGRLESSKTAVSFYVTRIRETPTVPQNALMAAFPRPPGPAFFSLNDSFVGGSYIRIREYEFCEAT